MRYAVISLGVFATTLALLGPARAAEAPVEPRPQVTNALHATHGAGARIVDDQGRTVILRGVNVNGIGEYYQEWPDLPSTLPLGDADFAAHGRRRLQRGAPDHHVVAP